MNRLLIYGVLLVLVVSGSPVVVATEENTIEKEFSSWVGVEYSASLNIETNHLILRVTNPHGRSIPSGYTLVVNNHTVEDEDYTIAPGHTIYREFNLSRELNILTTDHEIVVSSFGGNATFRVEKQVDRSLGTYPYITEIEMSHKRIGDRNYSAIHVTAENPGGRPYLLIARAHTLHTSGYYDSLFIPANGTGTALVPLEEDFDEPVAGELRMYRGDILDPGDGIDQVEFTSERDGETNFERQAYEPIIPPWESNPYRYENESFENQHDGVPEPLHAPKAYAAGLVVLVLLALGTWWRRRQRKWR